MSRGDWIVRDLFLFEFFFFSREDPQREDGGLCKEASGAGWDLEL
jgi:hypothetical protein